MRLKTFEIADAAALVASGQRPAGYVEALLSCATARTETTFTVDRDAPCWKYLHAKYKNRLTPYRPPTSSSAPMPAPRVSRPGDAVKAVLDEMGYAASWNCGCAKFAKKMNDWGWSGCVKHRKAIIDWFTAKAREQNIVIGPATILKLLRAAWRAHRSR